jgi:hypothetical protein
VHVGRGCLWVLKTRSDEGMPGCRAVASAVAIGGREGVRGNS